MAQLFFLLLILSASLLFARNALKVRRNILLGQAINRSDQRAKRWKTMLKVALGQSKMGKRPIAALLHLLVYTGFVIINIEVLEIVIDGIFGTHRVFGSFGILYNFLIGTFEILAALVIASCIVFFIRRNIIRLKRFSGTEMTTWPKSDANYILLAEILLMTAFLLMNAADHQLQLQGNPHYVAAGAFPISNWFGPMLLLSTQNLVLLERGCWWFHIIGIFAFLNYLPYSKHFHILLAFPNTYFSNLNPQGKLNNMASVTPEVKAMIDPDFVPPATETILHFGAKDATDLTWKNLLDAYTCTECGRCTSVCPANLTGKLLSPRKIMMDTRDRIAEIGKNLDQHDASFIDEKSLLDSYISREEIWACTSCNACVEACPININPLEIITELRRYVVMEESKAPNSLNNMFSNLENNGAPWKYAAADRLNWIEES
ncbi:MAG: 4Fe-4S dicluster domain-containing protein [Janthinobacterium lividum]